ncbi:8883_t:CDS:2 [Cetraspora pellucida]|uniref:8883_t:CDS:1 n=1 Tax=Cetraspora pellucida TaxID=1433469 RepID=A0A9N9I2B0_9GLOM|nr:8883_t:CDS:2 [Cetraspora pellucida]
MASISCYSEFSLKTGWMRKVSGSSNQYVVAEIFWTILKGPINFEISFFDALFVLFCGIMFDAFNNTKSPSFNSSPMLE